MIKVAGFLRRAGGVSHEQLREHWEHTHAPRVARYARPERYSVTFFDAPGASFDGLACLYMRDEEHFRTAFSPEQVAETNQDGFTALIDPAAAVSLFTEEHVFIDGPSTPWKFVFLARRREGVTHEEYIRTWLTEHSPAAARLLSATASRYVVSPVHGPPGAPYDGMAEVWFESPAAWDALAAAAGAAEQDEFLRLTDQAGSFSFAGREVTYV